MKIELSIYRDRTPISTLPPYLQQAMRQSGIIQDEDVNVTFCGSIITEQGISVFFPRNTYLPESNTKEGFQQLHSLLKLFDDIHKNVRAKSMRLIMVNIYSASKTLM